MGGRLGFGTIAAGLTTVGGSATDSLGTTAAAAVETAREDREPPQLRRKGRWLVDRHGRVVIIHGVNLVYKHRPYVPPNTRAGFQARDARWLRRHGFKRRPDRDPVGGPDP